MQQPDTTTALKSLLSCTKGALELFGVAATGTHQVEWLHSPPSLQVKLVESGPSTFAISQSRWAELQAAALARVNAAMP